MNLEKLEKMVAVFGSLACNPKQAPDIQENVDCALQNLAYKIAVELEKEEKATEGFTPRPIYDHNDPMFLGKTYTTEQVNLRTAIDAIEKAFKE